MTQYHTGGRLSQSAWISIEGHWNFVRLWFSCCLAYLVFAVKLLKSRRISFCLLVFQATGFGTQTQSKADKTAKSSVSQSNGFLSTAPKWGHTEFRFVIIVTYLLSKLQLITCFLYLLLFYLIILPFLLRYLENLNGVQKGRNVKYEGLMKRFLFCFKPSTSAWDEKKKNLKQKWMISRSLSLWEHTWQSPSRWDHHGGCLTEFPEFWTSSSMTSFGTWRLTAMVKQCESVCTFLFPHTGANITFWSGGELL